LSRQVETFANYWRVLWRAIITTIAGLGVTVKYLFSRPVTIEYPDALPHIPDGWRGIHAYEADRCTLCRLCERICPVQCITIEAAGKGKEAQLLRYEIDYGLCLFCNLCAEVCPVVCLWMTGEWDLACYKRDDCIVHFHARNPDEERKKLWPSLASHLQRAKRPAGATVATSQDKKTAIPTNLAQDKDAQV